MKQQVMARGTLICGGLCAEIAHQVDFDATITKLPKSDLGPFLRGRGVSVHHFAQLAR